MLNDGRQDQGVWHVRMPDLRQAKLQMPDLVTPELHWLEDEEEDLNDYLKDPTHPVLCVARAR